NTLDTLYKEQIAEDIVWDIIDELEQIALQQ
nr:Chain E, Peptide from COMPASS component BRE2 [Saccharomyces cerevisiae S288C]